MKTTNKPEIKIKLQFDDKSLKFLNFKNYIIAISHNSNNITFYDINISLKKSFTIEFIQDKLYDQWKLYFTKDKLLFIIGYANDYKDYLVEKEDKNLGIYLLNIEKRTINKKSSFNYNYFVENKKEDKLYIVNDEAIIAYDFKLNTQKEKKIKLLSENEKKKLIFVDDYLLLITIVEVQKWLYSISEVIFIDKNLEKIIKKNTDPVEDIVALFDFKHFYNFQKDFQQISDNIFYINDDEEFLEIKLKEKENILNDKDNKNWEDIFNSHVIHINDKRTNMSLHILDDKNFLINVNNNTFYLCNSNDLKIITKIKLNLQLDDLVKNSQLLLFKMKKNYYDFYYISQKNELLYITNKHF